MKKVLGVIVGVALVFCLGSTALAANVEGGAAEEAGIATGPAVLGDMAPEAETGQDGAEEEVVLEVNITEEPGVATNLPADVVAKVLPDTLKEYADVFCEEEREHGVNLLFVAAIARQETSSGTAGVANSRNNLFGNRGENGYMRFDGFEESIRYEFDVLQRLYIDAGRTTVDSISKKYCEPPGPWSRAVSSILGEYAEEAQSVVDGEE